MTISYTSKVSKSRIGSFIRVVFLWKGSIYKLVYKEFFIFILLYYTINFFYRFAMNEYQKNIFEQIVLYCDTFVNLIPLPFVLGFFVSLIVGRWWNQFKSIPFPDDLMIFINTLIQGKDEQSRLIRRTLMRYLNLTSVLIFRSISAPVKKRFPDMESLVDAGFMTYKEFKIYDNLATPHSKWFIPCIWFSNLLAKTYKQNRMINENISFRTILAALIEFRNKCADLYAFDWISIPLVYTQVVTLANYMYFMANLMGRQILEPQKHYTNRFNIYFPIFTFLQFLFYMGWLKVAEQLMNPFGEDEDDFEINWIIDRNFQVSMMGVDELHMEYPDLEKDVYWDEPEPELPYTEASKFYKRNSWLGSTADIHLTREDVNEIHKDWLSQENLKNLIPFQNALYRFSSKNFVRSRKSNFSVKSDTMDFKTNSQTSIQIEPSLDTLNNFPQYPAEVRCSRQKTGFPYARSSISNHLLQATSNLEPIKEKRFVITRVEDNDTSENNKNAQKSETETNTYSKSAEHLETKNDMDIPTSNQNAKNLTNDLNMPNGGVISQAPRKKISTASINSSITENDLTVKGNISNLARFHNKKMREKLLKSASGGYVAENFTNTDTPYLKNPPIIKIGLKPIKSTPISASNTTYYDAKNIFGYNFPTKNGGFAKSNKQATGTGLPPHELGNNDFQHPYMADSTRENQYERIRKPGLYHDPPSPLHLLRAVQSPSNSPHKKRIKRKALLKNSTTHFHILLPSKVKHKFDQALNLISNVTHHKKSNSDELLADWPEKRCDYHPFMGSKHYTVRTLRSQSGPLTDANRDIPCEKAHEGLSNSRSSLTSEIKSWVYPLHQQNQKNDLTLFSQKQNQKSSSNEQKHQFTNHTQDRNGAKHNMVPTKANYLNSMDNPFNHTTSRPRKLSPPRKSILLNNNNRQKLSLTSDNGKLLEEEDENMSALLTEHQSTKISSVLPTVPLQSNKENGTNYDTLVKSYTQQHPKNLDAMLNYNESQCFSNYKSVVSQEPISNFETLKNSQNDPLKIDQGHAKSLASTTTYNI